MADLTINSVCSKKQVYPIVLSFQNGYPNKRFQFDCALIQDEEGNKTVATEINKLVYAGHEENEDLEQTFILARNRTTGEVRLIETGCAVLKPFHENDIRKLGNSVLEPDKPNHLQTREGKLRSKREKNQQDKTSYEPVETNVSQVIKPSEQQEYGTNQRNKDTKKANRRNHSQQTEKSDLNLIGLNYTELELERSKYSQALEANHLQHLKESQLKLNRCQVHPHLNPDRSNYLQFVEPNQMQAQERSELKHNELNNPELKLDRSNHSLLPEPNRAKYSPPEKNELELNRFVKSKESMHMPDILEKGGIRHVRNEEGNKNHASNITAEPSPSKYKHIMNYYCDELFEPSREEEKIRKDNDKDFTTVKEMFARALGLKIKFVDKRKKNVTLTIRKSEKHNMNVNSPVPNNKTKYIKNVVQNPSGNIFYKVPYETKAYICDKCNKEFEDKGSLIFHLVSHKFTRHTKKATFKTALVKRIVGNANSRDNVHRKQNVFDEDGRLAMKRNHSRSEITKLLKDNVVKICDGDDATLISAIKVSGSDLVQEGKKLDMLHDEIEITDNFEDSNDECPVQLTEENFPLNKANIGYGLNLIFDKTFDENGSNSLAHNIKNDLILAKESIIIINNETKQEYKETETVEVYDYKLKHENEEKVKHLKTEKIHEEFFSNDRKITAQSRVITRRMHLAARKCINDIISVRQSEITATDKTNDETIQEKKEIETIQVTKVHWEETDKTCNKVRNDAIRTNTVVTRRMVAQIENHEKTHDTSNNKCNVHSTFICNDCGRSLKSKLLLITHIKCDHNTSVKAKKKKVTASNAKTNAKLGNALKFPLMKLARCNLLNQASVKTYKCVNCEYKTPYPSRFDRHSRKHATSFKCSHCNKIFRKSHDLKVHLRCHTGDKPFECQCGDTFAKKYTLNRHLKTHTAQKNHKCPLCASSFKLQSGLKRHLKIHGEKTLKCTTCEASFSDGSSLKRHKRCHTGQKPYSCNSCKYSTANGYDLKRHSKTCKARCRETKQIEI